MSENINSVFFKKILFSYISNKNILKLIKYNKSLQKLLDINIFNYRIFSGRYIIYGVTNKVKEYESIEDNLIFEGECINGKRNGERKEYLKSGKILFEGEYLMEKEMEKEKNIYI